MRIVGEMMRLAARQGGYARREQLVALGLSPSAIDRRVNEGELTPVTPGVYRLFPPRDHTDLLRGAVLALPDAVVSHQSAAYLHGFSILPEMQATVVVPSQTTEPHDGAHAGRGGLDGDVPDDETNGRHETRVVT
jgi:hypothetical protein